MIKSYSQGLTADELDRIEESAYIRVVNKDDSQDYEEDILLQALLPDAPTRSPSSSDSETEIKTISICEDQQLEQKEGTTGLFIASEYFFL